MAKKNIPAALKKFKAKYPKVKVCVVANGVLSVPRSARIKFNIPQKFAGVTVSFT